MALVDWLIHNTVEGWLLMVDWVVTHCSIAENMIHMVNNVMTF